MRMRWQVLSIVSVVCFAAGAAHSEPELFPADAFANYSPDTANGEVVFNAAGCASCHAVEGTFDILAGGLKIETKFGNIYTPNITSHASAGIGNWSNANFLNAVMRGVSPEGETYYGAVFPYAAYAQMRPEDLLDLKAYMATLPASDAMSSDHEINFVNSAVLDMWSGERAALPPQSDPQMARGQYLVEAMGHCSECHTPRESRYGLAYELDAERAFMGETSVHGEYAPDISGDRLKRFGAEKFVVGVLGNADKLNGTPMSSPTMRRIVQGTSRLSVADRAAMYAYLTGENIDPSIFPAETLTVSVASAPAPEPVKDMTGATALMQRINAFCEAPDAPIAASTPAAATMAAVDASVVAAADEVVEKHCRSCHGPGQTYQQSFLTGDMADMAFDPSAVRPGDPEGSLLFESIASNRMPLGKKLTSDELAALSQWISALGASQPASTAPKPAAPAPEVDLPAFIGGSFDDMMSSAVLDLNALEERDRPFIRYFSFAQMPLPPVDCNETGARRNPVHYFHAGLNKLLNSVSRAPRLMTVAPVKGTDGALVRVDLRDLGWTSEDWEALSTKRYTSGVSEAGYTQAAWEELANPYSYAVEPSSNSFLNVLSQGTQSAVPVLRADWFARFGSQSPYYDLLLRLPDDIRILEARMGLDIDNMIRANQVVRAGFSAGASGVSDHNRMLERFDLGRGGYYWKSYDFAGSFGKQSLLLHPDGPGLVSGLPSGTEGFEHDGGEMIFSLPNGMQGYYLSTAEGERLLVGPTSIVSFRKKAIGKGIEIVNARSCFDCHENGMIAKRDEIRDHILASTRFDRRARDVLLQMYPEQDQIDAYFKQDASVFIDALQQIGATQLSASGRPVSLQAPNTVGGGEIITYLADVQFGALDGEALAREFNLDRKELVDRVTSLGDPNLSNLLRDWISKTDAGLTVSRAEVEGVWDLMLPRLTKNRPLRNEFGVAYPAAPLNNAVADAFQSAAQKQQTSFVPAETGTSTYQAPTTVSDKLVLALNVPNNSVRVNDLLRFEVKANRRCELQVLYVEEGETVEELPQPLLGPAFLEPGETRTIPFPGSGYRLRFDSPGQNETMVAFCREGGLGSERLNAQQVLQRAKELYQPFSRGIVIETAEKVTQDQGQSALNVITFNVSP